MNYYGTSINDSATIVGECAAAISGKEYLAAKFDSNGKIAVCSTAGEKAIGLIPAEEGTHAAGDSITVQVKDIGLMVASAAIAAGAAVTTTNAGKAVAVSAAGQFILGYALRAATAAGQVIPVQIAKGYYYTA